MDGDGWAPSVGPDIMRWFPWVEVGFLEAQALSKVAFGKLRRLTCPLKTGRVYCSSDKVGSGT